MKALGLIAALLSLSLAAAELPPVPSGDARIEYVRLFEIPGSATGNGLEAVCVADGGFYLAGSGWSSDSGDNLWLWRMDRNCTILWQKELPPAGNRPHEEYKVLGLAANPGGGVRAVVTRLGDLATIDVSARGEITRDRPLKKLGTPTGMLALTGGDLLLFGSTTSDGEENGKAWVTRCQRGGVVLWKQSFDPGKDDLLLAACEMKDGSLVLVGQTGEFTALGQGPSRLWLLRLDAKGRKRQEAFIENGRTLPTGRALLAATEDGGLLVPYTRAQLPPLSGAPVDGLPEFEALIACFDTDLQGHTDVPAPSTATPGATTIDAGPPLVSLSASAEYVLIRDVDNQGKELRRARIAADGATPLGTLTIDGKVTAFFSYWPAEAGERSFVMVAGLKD